MTIPLSDAKARLSEVVRTVRRDRVPVVVTVDGEPAVAITPVMATPELLTPRQVAVAEALRRAILEAHRPEGPFDAVELVREGRR